MYVCVYIYIYILHSLNDIQLGVEARMPWIIAWEHSVYYCNAVCCDILHVAATIA